MKRLCISYNEDWGTGNFYDSIAGLEKLEHLDLYCSKVDDTFLANLVRNSLNIKFLEIQTTGVTDRGVASISKLQYLRHLDLSNCKITNHALRHISKAKVKVCAKIKAMFKAKAKAKAQVKLKDQARV